MKLQWIAFAVFLLAGYASSSKILLLAPFPGKSHWLMFQPIIYELLNRGHEVTSISNFELTTDSKNYRGVIIKPQFDFEAQLNMTEFFEVGGKSESILFKIRSVWNFGLVTTKVAFDSPVVKSFIENDKTKFDLVISEQFYHEAFNMFAVKYNCPLITINTVGISDYMDRARGALTPLSHVPHYFSYKSDQMTFLERLENTALSLFDAIGRKFYYLPKHTQLAREAFSSLENQQGGRLPTTEDLEKKIALHLVNDHSAFTLPRPKMPGFIEIGGVHIKKPKPLPDDIQTFLDGAENGVIYISFGSFLRSSMMPKAKYEAMLEVFRKLKQRVLWKWESDQIPELPSNVIVRKWLPQSDVLAHKNIKLFIAHGGLFGLQEAVYNAVPMIIFPFYGDQHLNGHKMERRGVGLLQSMREITADSLLAAINEIVNNQTYYKNVKTMSEVFKTNQNDPLETAMWWIEYVIKFNGAPHLQSHARNLPWFRYLLLDIAIVVFGSLYILYDLLKSLFNKADAKNPEPKKDSAEKKSKKAKKEN